MNRLVARGYTDGSHWDMANMTEGALISGRNCQVLFAAAKAGGTLQAIGSRDINGTITYWEVKIGYVFERREPYEESLPYIKFGLTTLDESKESLKDKLGDSWTMDNKGKKLHHGHHHDYGRRLPNYSTYGMLFHANRGTVAFFLNGKPLPVAFQNIFSTLPFRPFIEISGGTVAAVVCRSHRTDLSLLNICMRKIRTTKNMLYNDVIDQIPRHLGVAARTLPCGCGEAGHRRKRWPQWHKYLPHLRGRRLVKRTIERCKYKEFRFYSVQCGII